LLNYDARLVRYRCQGAVMFGNVRLVQFLRSWGHRDLLNFCDPTYLNPSTNTGSTIVAALRSVSPGLLTGDRATR
jgi:hypothetical protein